MANNQIPLPKNGYISSVEASTRFNITNDYASLLCRQKKVEGMLVGRSWFIDPTSLQTYLRKMEEQKQVRRMQLSKKLQQEYTLRVSKTNDTKGEVLVAKFEPFAKRPSNAPAYALAAVAFLSLYASSSAPHIIKFIDASGEVASAIFAAAPQPLQLELDMEAPRQGGERVAMMGQQAFALVAYSKTFSPAIAHAEVLPEEVLQNTPAQVQQQSQEKNMAESARRSEDFLQGVVAELFLAQDTLRYFPKALGENGLFIWDTLVMPPAYAFVRSIHALGDAQVNFYFSVAAALAAPVAQTGPAPLAAAYAADEVSNFGALVFNTITAAVPANDITQAANLMYQPMAPVVGDKTVELFVQEVGNNSVYLFDITFGFVGERVVEATYALGDAQAYAYTMLWQSGTELIENVVGTMAAAALASIK